MGFGGRHVVEDIQRLFTCTVLTVGSRVILQKRKSENENKTNNQILRLPN